MAFFVFNWTKRTYILAVLSLVLLVITAKHKEYFCCEEKPLSSFEKFEVWLGFMEKPKPCPGKEDLYTMAVEMGISAAAVLASATIYKVWDWSKSLMGRTIQIIKGGFKYLKDRVPFGKSTKNPPQEDPPKYKYFFFRNAYEQRKIIMVMREGDVYEEIFVYSPEKKKMECVLSYRKGSR
ncbi:uncharacterized protein LOC133181603 [Saccostrea echinata]|uniref:uncharacterized protein LOC133181603 n=1 Tax=Saccostrea echinata TaxID=191078 RepID=UPI002A81CB09|nr:uncharacterized protein LOC133181603 [Saccostrea echinata]